MSGAIARLYTADEVLDAQNFAPQSETEFRLLHALGTTTQWVQDARTACCVCDKPLNRSAAYLVVLLPGDPEAGLGASGGVCSSCGGLPRIALEAHATRVAILMFEEVGGHA